MKALFYCKHPTDFLNHTYIYKCYCGFIVIQNLQYLTATLVLFLVNFLVLM